MQLAKQTPVLPSALLLPACLSACASSKQRDNVLTSLAERLTCKAEPAVPAEITDRSTADAIISLADARQDCRSALGRLADWAGSFDNEGRSYK